MAYRSSLGIAVEETGLSIVHLAKSFGRLKVLAQVWHPLSARLNLEEKLTVAREKVEGFLAENRVHAGAVCLGIPRQMAFIRQVELPLAVKENLRETLLYEIEKYVPFQPEDICFDFQILAEDRERNQLKLMLVMTRKSALRPFLSLADGLGKAVFSVEISSTALLNYLREAPPPSQKSGSVVVFGNEDHLELNFVKEGVLSYSRAIARNSPRGDSAELVSREFEIMRQALELDSEPLSVLFAGLEEDRQALAELCQRAGWRMDSLAWSRAGLQEAALLPAYGLALRAVREEHPGLNLLPPELQKKASRLGFHFMLVLLVLTVLAGLAWGGGVVLKQRATMKRIETDIKRLGTEIASIEGKRKAIKELENDIDYLVLLRRDTAIVLDILRELTQLVPEGAWVRSLNFSGAGVQLEGYGDAASELIPLLEASPLFKDVAFLSPITKTRDGRDQFRIGLSLEGRQAMK